MRACKVPCVECPFRKDSTQGWLADYNPKQLHTLVMSEQPFPCHLTHQEEVLFQDAYKLPLCKGALAYMRKNAKSPRNPELNKIVQEIDREMLANILSTPEFFEHHKLANQEK